MTKTFLFSREANGFYYNDDRQYVCSKFVRYMLNCPDTYSSAPAQFVLKVSTKRIHLKECHRVSFHNGLLQIDGVSYSCIYTDTYQKSQIEELGLGDVFYVQATAV